MANISDATDVNALARNRSDSEPAIILPIHMHTYVHA